MMKKKKMSSLIKGIMSLFMALQFCSIAYSATVDLQINERVLKVEVAVEIEDQMRGLQFRKSLERNRGMLFVYERPTYLRFWMKNTTIPLDLAYLDENGKILQIIKLNPLDLATRKAKYPSKYAIEVNRGWFEENEIGVGDVVEIPEL